MTIKELITELKKCDNLNEKISVEINIADRTIYPIVTGIENLVGDSDTYFLTITEKEYN